MNDKAKWMWAKKDKSLYSFIKFRKSFLYSGEQNVFLDITADSRYYLYINGQYVNMGPVRCYPKHYKYDKFDITPYLLVGKNVIAVLVYKFGQDNFQYIKAQEGLLVSVYGGISFTSNNTFLCKVAMEYDLHAPEISVQQQWEEQVDGSKIDDWISVAYDDSDWENAKELSDNIVDGHHFDLSERGIPLLTLNCEYPTRFIEANYVQKPQNIISFDLRQFFKRYVKYDHTCFVFNIGIVITFSCTENAKIKIKYTTLPQECYFNGEKVDLKKNDVYFQINKGENSFYFDMPSYAHSVSHCLVFDSSCAICKEHVYLAGSFELSQKAMDENKDLGYYQFIPKMKNCGCENTIKTALRQNKIQSVMPFLQDATCCIHHDNVFASCYNETVVAPAKINNETAILGGSDYLVVNPSPNSIRLLVDYGKELVGFIEFEVFAEEGVVLDFHNFEFIQPDGRRNYAEGMNNTMRYITKRGYQKYRSIIRRGFRFSYITITNVNNQVKIKGLKVINSTYPQANKGDFICNDWKLNRIYECGKETLKCCSEDTYTDCPTYEQTHWVGDARNEALIDWVINGDSRLWFRCLQQVGQSLDISKITLSQVPSGWYNILPTWSLLWMRSINEYYLYTGDESGARTLFTYLEKNIEGIKSFINEYGLFEITAWNMFDWAAMDTPSDGIVIHQNCTLVQSLDISAKLAEKLGYLQLAKDWDFLKNNLKAAINKYAYNNDKMAYTDCLRRKDGQLIMSNTYSQQTQSTAVAGGVADGVRKEIALKYMVNPPEGFVKSGSPFFEFFLLENLMENEKSEDFINTVLRDWGFMVDKGGNTFWEMWTFVQTDGRLTRSHCHGWSAAPVYFLAEYVLGIRPLEAGYKKVMLKPHACGLEWVRGSVPTPYGNIDVSWENVNGEMVVQVNAPKEIEIIK